MRARTLRSIGGWTLRLAVAGTVVGGLLGAAPEASAQTQVCQGGNLRVGYIADAVGLDPHLTTALNSELMFQHVYSGLLQTTDRQEIAPDLAESWEVAPDGLTYTFKLRPNVKFHNGRTVNVADVVYSFDRIINSKGPWSARFRDIDKLETPDDRTVVFKMKTAFAPFLSVLATAKAAIVPKEEIEKHGDLQKVMVGTGPFKFVEYRPGTGLKLARNPDYFLPGIPRVETMEIKVIPDEVTRIAALRTGEVDLTQITDPLSRNILARDSSLKLQVVPMLRRNLVVLNAKRAPLDDMRVREAIALAIDRNEIIQLALAGLGEVSGPFPNGLAAWVRPLSEIPFYNKAPDIEGAKKLLAEAGHPNGFSITTYASPQYRAQIPIAEILQRQLKKIGIDFKIEVIEWGVLLDRWGKNNFDTLTMNYAGRSDPYFYTFERLHSKSPGNASRLEDAEIDRLSEAGARTFDPAKRKEIYDALQIRMAETSALVYLTTETELFAMKDTVQGYRGMPDGGRTYLAETWLTTACKR